MQQTSKQEEKLLAELKKIASEGFKRTRRREGLSVETSTLQYVLFILLFRRIQGDRVDTNNIPGTTMGAKNGVTELFGKIREKVEQAQNSEEECRAVFAELLVWTGEEIARPHLPTSQAERAEEASLA